MRMQEMIHALGLDHMLKMPRDGKVETIPIPYEDVAEFDTWGCTGDPVKDFRAHG